MPTELHVILGTGPVGCWTARALRNQGRAVRAVNRSGVRPGLMPADVEMVKVDLADPTQAATAATGASVVYQALNPPYHLWHELFPALQSAALSAAKTANARYVSVENLYMYDSSKPMTEASQVAPVSKKGALRQKMAEEVMAAHARGEVGTTALRSSDYYGPGVLGSALGERVFGNLVAGRRHNSVVRRRCRIPSRISRTSASRRPRWERTTKPSARSGLPRMPLPELRAKWSRRLVASLASNRESARYRRS